MNITTEPVEPRQVKLTVEVDDARLTRVMEAVARELSKRYKVPGYRPGKVPLKRMVALLGEDSIREEAMEQLGREVIAEAMQAEGTLPAAPVHVEVAQQSPPVFTAMVPLPPQVDLGDHRALRLAPAEIPEVTEADIDDLFEHLQRDMAQLAPVDRPAEAEDVVEISLVARKAVALSPDEGPVLQHDQLWLALNEEGAARAGIPPAAVDEIIGLGKGLTHRFAVSYPEDWEVEELRGRPVDFEVVINEVSALDLPEIDDAFAQKVSDAPDLEALRERAREDIALRRRNEARDMHLEALLDALIDQATISFPPAMLEVEIRELASDLRERVERQGFEWQRWLDLQEKREEDLWRDLEDQADKQLRRSLVMQRFVDLEALEVTEDEIQLEMERFEAMMADMPRKQRPNLDDLRRRTGNRILTGRAIERLMAIAAGEAERATATEPAGDEADGDEAAGAEDTDD